MVIRVYASTTLEGNANTYVGPAGTIIVDADSQISVADEQGTPGGIPVSANTGNITFADTTIATANHSNITVEAGSQSWVFETAGTLLVPTPHSHLMTLTCGTGNYVPTLSKPTLTLTGDPWFFQGEFQYDANGVAELLLNNPFPELDNPGYDSNDSFVFDSTVTGIPGYVLKLELTDVTHPGPAGWTANVNATEPPAYPSTLLANGALKFTSDTASWTMGLDGQFTLPNNTAGAVTAISLNGGPAVGYTTATNVPTVADSGVGSGLTVDLVADGFSISSVTVNQPGQNYAPGDQIMINQESSTGTGELTIVGVRNINSTIEWPGMANISASDGGVLTVSAADTNFSGNVNIGMDGPEGLINTIQITTNGAQGGGEGWPTIGSEGGMSIGVGTTQAGTSPLTSYIELDLFNIYIKPSRDTWDPTWSLNGQGNLALAGNGASTTLTGANVNVIQNGFGLFGNNTAWSALNPFDPSAGGSWSFNGSDQLVTCGNTRLTGPWTLQFWMRAAVDPSGINIFTPVGSTPGLTVRFTDLSNIQLSDNQGTDLVFSISTISLDTWYFVTVACDGSSLYNVWLNGTPSGVAANSFDLVYSFSNIGGDGYVAPPYFTGYMTNISFNLGSDSINSNISNSFVTPTEPLTLDSTSMLLALASSSDTAFVNTAYIAITSAATLEVDGNAWGFGTDGVLTLPDGGYIDNNGGITRLGAAGDVGAQIGSSDTQNYVTASNQGVTIQTLADSTNSLWVFDLNGVLNLPNSNGQIGQLEPPYTGLEFRAGSGSDWIGISYGEIDDNNTSYFYFDKDGSDYTTANHQAHLQLKNPVRFGEGHLEWLFDADGNLTIPNGGKLGYDLLADHTYGTIVLQSAGGAGTYAAIAGHWSYVMASDNEVRIQTGDGGNPYTAWTFGADGNLTLPVGGTINYSDGSNALVGGGTADLGNYSFSGDSMLMPLHARMNSGGVGNTNSAEFGTVVNTYGDNGVVQNSQIYMSAGTGEARILVNMEGHTLVYYGTEEVENPNFTGMVAMDPNVRSQYAIALDSNSNIILGGAQPGGTLISSDYIAGLGSLNSDYNLNGVYVDTMRTVVSGINNVQIQTGGGNVWTFGFDGNIVLPGTASILSDNVMTLQSGDTLFLRSDAGGVGIYSGNSQLSTTSDLGIEAYADSINLTPNAEGAVLIDINNTNAFVEISGPVGSWMFTGDGNLTLPTGGQIVSAAGTGNVVITANDGTAQSWLFDGNGNLVLPAGGTINWADGSNALVGGTTSPPNYASLAQSVVVTPPTFGNGGGGELRVNVNASVLSNSVNIGNVGFMITALGTGSSGVGLLAEGTPTAGVQTIQINGLSGTNQTYYVSAFVTSQLGTTWSEVYLATSGICLIAGTMITLADGTKKAIENITYSDTLLAWDFDQGKFTTAKPLWIKQGETGGAHNRLTFSDGTVLRTFDQHRIFNKQWGAFTYPMTDNTPLGTLTFNEHGDEVMLVNKEQVFGRVEYYNVITDRHINLFSDSILTSCRLNNAYPIVDMQFNKAGRTLRDASEFAGIDARWIAGLRLCEQTYSADDMRWYVARLERLDIAQLDSDQSAVA